MKPPSADDERCFSLEAKRDGTTLCLKLAGEFDWAVTDHVEGALEHGCDISLKHVVFDLSALTFIDLSGLKVILEADEGAQAKGFDVKVVRPRSLANRIFTLTRAGKTLEMADPL